MLITSSPVVFPRSPSPPLSNKRPRPDNVANPTRSRPTKGGFIDDSSDDEDDATVAQPPQKKRALETTADEPSLDLLTNPTIDQAEPQDPDAPPTPLEVEGPLGQTDSQLAADLQQAEDERFELLLNASRTNALFDSLHTNVSSSRSFKITTCDGKTASVRQRKEHAPASYESMIAARSRTKQGRATRSYYGIDIHDLVNGAQKEIADQAAAIKAASETAPTNSDRPIPTVEAAPITKPKKSRRSILWTEKYRARNFMDLVGDDLTNRQVLRWLKRWDPLVFPNAAKTKSAASRLAKQQQDAHGQQTPEEKPHRKILMLTGPPGLGKTTLAHVCARQAGYEVMEINASDDRSRDVVRGRIRTSLGTESVKAVEHTKAEPGKQQKVARPVCVIVDEVDGVVGGSGAGGEGGFVKALIDLVLLDQKNSSASTAAPTAMGKRKKKGDDFRQMRPLILICNDVYHASLRPLRQSGHAEIIHVGKPTVDAVVTRLKSIFEKEGVPCEKDAARRICEAAWGMTTGIDARKGAESTAEGDLRGIMVVGEWVASRLKSALPDDPRLTRQWVEKNILHDLAHGGGGARGIGRGGTKEIVSRIFQDGAGFPKQVLAPSAQAKKTRHEQPQTHLSFGELEKRYAMERLREMVDTSGEVDRIMTEVFAEYPNREFNDDGYLSKPNEAYEWLYFHDSVSHRIFSAQEWELGMYISQPVLACHSLFATPKRRHIPGMSGFGDRKWGNDEEDATPPVPFSGPRADYEAFEAEKHNRAALQGIQAQLPPSLMRAFRSPEHVATDFLPYLVRLVSPDVKPVVIGGSDRSGSVASVRREGEKTMVKRAAGVLAEVGIQLLKGKIEEAGAAVVNRPQWVYRMEPDLDVLATFETAGAHVLAAQAPTRFAVRQVLDQELYKTRVNLENAARQARFRAGGSDEDYQFDDKENRGTDAKDVAMDEDAEEPVAVKRDFFGRVIQEPLRAVDANARKGAKQSKVASKAWVTFNEGLNNAVRKPISLDDFLRGL